MNVICARGKSFGSDFDSALLASFEDTTSPTHVRRFFEKHLHLWFHAMHAGHIEVFGSCCWKIGPNIWMELVASKKENTVSLEFFEVSSEHIGTFFQITEENILRIALPRGYPSSTASFMLVNAIPDPQAQGFWTSKNVYLEIVALNGYACS